MIGVAFAVFFVVLKQNSYAASTVTVEPGQPVISTGVYGIVRHPMYAGALLLVVFTPLALGSYWGLLVAVACLPALAWRLLDEEKVLRRDLPGYADYCRTCATGSSPASGERYFRAFSAFSALRSSLSAAPVTLG